MGGKHINFEYRCVLFDDVFRAATANITDRDAVSQFERVRDDLSILMQNVSIFMDWWDSMNSSLANLDAILPQVKVDGRNIFRTVAVEERWIRVHSDYVSYERQVRQRQYFCRDILMTLLSTDDRGGRLLQELG